MHLTAKDAKDAKFFLFGFNTVFLGVLGVLGGSKSYLFCQKLET
jgi:hypothetical protein